MNQHTWCEYFIRHVIEWFFESINIEKVETKQKKIGWTTVKTEKSFNYWSYRQKYNSFFVVVVVVDHLTFSSVMCLFHVSPSIHWCHINYPFLCQCFDSNNNNNKNHPDQSRVVTPIDFQLVWRNCHLLFWKFEPLLLLLLLRNSGP